MKGKTEIPYATAPRTRKFGVFTSLILFTFAVTLSAFFTTSLPSLRDFSFHRGHVEVVEEWKDDIWPIREQTPWDISTDFPHPRVLEYEVDEGTWLRLDVHPKTGDIVFDMLGDLYCISARNGLLGKANRAHPITLGVPYDSDPHFSPEGDRIVFRSDARLGVDNIWAMKWSGCEQMNLRPSVDDVVLPALQSALFSKAEDEALLRNGVSETTMRKQNRLIREGRAGASMVTNETYRYVTDARFHPSGEKIIATKWYTSERSLGAGEGWEFPVLSTELKIESGSGKRIVGRTLPRGWNPSQYGDQQIGPEQFIWNGEDGLIYSKNVRDEFQFTYSKDVHQGIYALFSYNLTTGKTETIVDASPGGASRPELSHDRRTLAFVRRVRDHEVLVLKDLETGSIHYAWDGLTFDLTTISAPMGTYPSFSFTPNSDAIIIWAAGKINHVPLSANERGERVRSGPVSQIKFTAHIEKHVAETRREESAVDLVGIETQEAQRVYAFRDLRVDENGRKVVFRAGNIPVVQTVGKESYTKVPTIYDDNGETPYYTPSFIPGTDGTLVIMSRWSDTRFTSFEISNLVNGTSHEVQGLPLGRYRSPVLCACSGSKRTIAFLKTGGDYLSGDIIATAGAGLYIGDIDITPSSSLSKLSISNLRFVPSDIDPETATLEFVEKNRKLLVQQPNQAFIVDLAGGPVDIEGKPPHFTIASGKMSVDLAVALQPRSATKKLINGEGSGFDLEYVAFVDFFHVYLAAGKDIKENEEVWSKPGNATKGLARLSLDGGHDIAWSSDGKMLFWLLGPYLHSLEVAHLGKCSAAIKNDPTTFGVSCVKGLVQYQEIVVEHSTDISRLKEQAQSQAPGENSDVVVVYNATILTMETGDIDKDLLHEAVLVVRGGVIESVSSADGFVTPEGANMINARGGFVIPGFIDAHAHWNGMSNPHPAKSWEQQTFLAYGVTTMHNPSSDNVDGFVERSRLESGQFVGPRIFHTGDVIYGAGGVGIHADVVDMADAYSTLIRIKAEGGPISTSYKNYNLPIRATRQRLLLAARNLSMLCVPEGGMNYDWDLSYIMDGMTTLEHSLPVPVQYDDVLTLFALSGTANTPTHLVNYGGTFGEEYIWAAEDVPNNLKQAQIYDFVEPPLHTHHILEGVTESTARPKLSYQFFNTSASNAKMVPRGLKTLVGAHGEPPLGLNYHYEMFFTQQGGLSNYEVLQAATSWAAQVFGMFDSLGSLSPGKLADFLVYPPKVDLLQGPILDTLKLQFVARGGRIWVAETLEQLFPWREVQTIPPINP
ncbi:hypothetical protein GYMLUDRAFT_177108 [Collybiopsis luxurians FD-317 M1]|uniref:Amidohydrolase-related domain-containing protein n=1 Tax=Collybiopsis luxurians FD-317 M1 TaxID=944289 RepID=A0A0D0BXI3_9AGAR|nr:hypothetical protein GYMLUDRAFT_177108 [Collybiopsis luxurians FD-317 M1]